MHLSKEKTLKKSGKKSEEYYILLNSIDMLSSLIYKSQQKLLKVKCDNCGADRMLQGTDIKTGAIVCLECRKCHRRFMLKGESGSDES